MRYKIIAFVFFSFSIIPFVKSQDSCDLKYNFQLLPQSHIVQLYTADSRAHRLSVQKPINSRGYIGSMGGIFPVASLSHLNKILQFSVASSAYLTLNRWDNKGQVVNVDFFVDLLFDIQLDKNFSVRSGGGHTSQHLSDDALSAGMIQINYVRDYYLLFFNYSSNKKQFYAYGGITYNHNFKTYVDYSGQSIIQLGFEHSPVKWLKNNYLYYAFDLKLREESNFATSNNLQIGYKYALPMKHTARFAYNYFTGISEVGQTYKAINDFTTLGFYFDF